MGAPTNSFFSKTSLQGYGMATIAVTMLANLFNVLYYGVMTKDPSNGVMAVVGFVLALVLVVVFSKREVDVTKPQYAIIITLNTVLLFNANAGLNAALYNALGRGPAPAAPAGETVNAGFADAIKGIFIPRTPWISPDIPKVVALQEDLAAIEQSLDQAPSTDTIAARLNVVFEQQKHNAVVIDSLTKELTTVREVHQRTLEEMSTQTAAYNTQLMEIQRSLTPAAVGTDARELIQTLRTDVGAQQQEQQEAQERVQEELLQQRQLQQQQQVQMQQQQIQQLQLHEQIQQQQLQYTHVRNRLRERVN